MLFKPNLSYITQFNRILNRQAYSCLSSSLAALNTAAVTKNDKNKNRKMNKLKGGKQVDRKANDKRDQQSELRRLINSTLFINYEEEIAWRRQQARNTVLFLFKEWTPGQMDQFIDDCIGTSSRVKEIYLLCKRREPKRRLVLVEFESRECVDNLLNNYASHFYENGYTYTRLLFYSNNMSRKQGNKFYSSLQLFNTIKNSVNEFVDNEDYERLVGNKSSSDRFNFLTQLAESDTESDMSIEHFYDLLKIDEVSYRLRYFLASLIEESLKSMYKYSMCLPFGSSVNRLGRRNTDLDLGLWLNRLEMGESGEELNFLEQAWQPPPGSFVSSSSSESAQSPSRMFGWFKFLDNRSYFYNRDEMKQSDNQRKTAQKHLDLIQWLLRYVLPKTKVNYVIQGARVPIIKFDFEPIEPIKLNCDLSMSSLESSFLMSKLFWIYTNLDTRIAPLVFLIRTWAKLAGITCDERPSNNFTNFQLTCLAFNYLLRLNQPLIVPLDQLTYKPIKEQRASSEANNRMFLSVCSNIEKIRQLINSSKSGLNRDSLSDLFAGFFNYYAMFDFREHAVSLNNEISVRKNHTKDCVFVENPINDELNAASNVDQAHLEHFVSCCVQTANIIDAVRKQSPQNKLDLIEFLKQLDKRTSQVPPISSINDEMNIK